MKQDIDKLAMEYDPRKNLDAESLRQAFKTGYNKAKEKYKYTEEFIMMISHRITYKYYQEGKNHKGNMSVGGDELYGVRKELKDMIDSFYNEYPIAFE